jgi:hypothetical protein
MVEKINGSLPIPGIAGSGIGPPSRSAAYHAERVANARKRTPTAD